MRAEILAPSPGERRKQCAEVTRSDPGRSRRSGLQPSSSEAGLRSPPRWPTASWTRRARFHGCVAKSEVIRVVKDGVACRREETAGVWNQAGPRRPRGVSGTGRAAWLLFVHLRERHSEHVVAEPGSFRFVNAVCPAGTLVVGGGYATQRIAPAKLAATGLLAPIAMCRVAVVVRGDRENLGPAAGGRSGRRLLARLEYRYLHGAPQSMPRRPGALTRLPRCAPAASAAPTSRSPSSGSAATTSAGRIDEEADARGRRRRARRGRSRSSTPRTSTATRRQRGVPRPRARRAARPGRARDEVRNGDRRRRDRRARRRRRTSARRSRRRCGGSDRPDRPLPVPPARRRHADRGDARRDGRARPGRQGALHRLTRTSPPPRSRRRTRPPPRAADAASSRAQNEYSWLVREAERRAAARPASGSVSACSRTSRSRAACSPASTAAGEPAPEGTRLHGAGAVVDDATWTGSRRSTRSRRPRAGLLDVAIGGLAAQPASPRSSPARRRPSRCARTRPRANGSRRRRPGRAERPLAVLAELVAAAALVCLDPGHGTAPEIGRQFEPIGPGSAQLKIKDPGGAAGEEPVALAIARRTRRCCAPAATGSR